MRDCCTLLDPHAADGLAARPGLAGHQTAAEQGRGGLPNLFRAAADLHTAALAPASRMDLRLPHPHGARHCPCGLQCFHMAAGKAALRGGYPVCPQELLRLILMDMHVLSPINAK